MNVSPHLALASWGMILLFVMAIKRLAGTRGALLGIKRSRSEVVSALPLDTPEEDP
jgi:hypothetical protein